MTVFPPPLMTFPEAMHWAERGYWIRRAVWRITAAIFQEAGPGDLPLRWIRGLPDDGHRPGVYHYVEAAATGIVTNVKLTLADMQALDWTCETVDFGQASLTPEFTEPNLGRPGENVTPITVSGMVSGGGSGGSGGGSGGGAGGGSGGSSGGSGYPGGGSGGGSGGSTPVKKGPTGSRGIPALTLTVTPLNTGCVTRTPESPHPPYGNPIIDTFAVTVSLLDPYYKPGELWMLKLIHGSPTGPVTLLNTTLASGGSRDATFTLTALPGVSFDVTASVHLPFRDDLDVAVTEHAVMRPNCDICYRYENAYYNQFGPYGDGCYLNSGAGDTYLGPWLP